MITTRSVVLVVLALVLVASSRVIGQTITIVNHGFETDIVGNGSYISEVTPAGWSRFDPTGLLDRPIYNDLGVLNPTNTPLYPGGAPEGSKVALIFLVPEDEDDFNQPAGLQQTLLATLQASTRYTLTVQVGNIAPDGTPGSSILNGFPGYRIEFLAGNTLLAQDNNTLAPGEGIFALSTIQFTTGATHVALGQSLTIRLLNLNLNHPLSGVEVNFDDVQFSATAVPEPATSALALASLTFGITAWQRHRKHPRSSAIA
jgi:hypothetical protein